MNSNSFHIVGWNDDAIDDLGQVEAVDEADDVRQQIALKGYRLDDTSNGPLVTKTYSTARQRLVWY